eukprot:4142673-Heterocapsa_arctica.AAC.1
MKKQDEYVDYEDGHRRKRRRTYVDLGEVITNTYDKNDLTTSVYANQQARKRAEEIQAEVNKNRRRNNIEAHQNNDIFEIPTIENFRSDEMTEEQTNNSFFNGKE